MGHDPYLGRASARRRRRRQLRLLRTGAGMVAVIAVIAVVMRSGGGGGRRNASPPSQGTAGTADSTSTAPPTTLGPPASFAVAHLPAPLPQAVSRSSVVVENGRLVVLGGLHGRSPGTSTTQVLTLDPTSGAAVVAPPLVVATHDAAAALVAGGALLFGGGAATTVSEVQLVTPSGTRVVGRLPQPRSDVVAATVGGHAYVLGGFDGTRPTPDVLETDDGVTFHVVATLPEPVRYPAVVVVGAVIYLIGGQSVVGASGSGPPVTDVQAVDVATGVASVVSHLTAPLTEAAAFAVRGAIYVAGGIRQGVAQNGIYRLDPSSGSLTPAGALPEPRADAGVGQIGEATYLIGGEGPGRLASVVELQPA